MFALIAPLRALRSIARLKLITALLCLVAGLAATVAPANDSKTTSSHAANVATTTTPFRARPIELLTQLSELRKFEPAAVRTKADAPLTESDFELLRRIDQGQSLSETDKIDCYLVASGVHDAPRRAKYRQQLDAITATARQATAQAKTNYRRGDLLLKHLHAGPMKHGYIDDQTSLAVLLDTGKFNCVSATVLYRIVGTRLGLDVRAISIDATSAISGHALAVVVDGGKRIDVETTNGDGFDAPTKMAKLGAVLRGPQPDRRRGYEVDESFLAAMIGMNRASTRTIERRYCDALQAGLIAVAINVHGPRDNNNIMAAANEWGLRLLESERYEDSLRVLKLACDLDPSERPIAENYHYVTVRYAESMVKRRDDRKAVDILRAAAKSAINKHAASNHVASNRVASNSVSSNHVAGRDYFNEQADVFIRPADALLKQNRMSEARAVLARGLAVVDRKPAAELTDWLVYTYQNEADAKMMKQDYNAALAIYQFAIRQLPDNAKLKQGLQQCQLKGKEVVQR